MGHSRLGAPTGVAALAIFALPTLLHMALAAWVPLVQDEAYYALWATHPALGYYDHPPMVAWWIWVGEALFGPTPLSIRLPSVLAYAALGPITWRIAWRLTGDPRTARNASLFCNATVLILVMGFTATPDAPSTFFWALATMALVEIRCGDGASRGWWLLLGLAAGLGIDSKLTNLFLGAGLVGCLALTRWGRAQLTRPRLWAAVAICVAVVGPWLWWNWQTGGLGFQRQFGRVVKGGFAPHWMLDYALALVATVSPVLFVWTLRGMARVTRQADDGRAADGRAGVLMWLACPLLAYFTVHSTHAQVQANWIAPLIPEFAVLAALGTDTAGDRTIAFGAGVGVVLSLALLTAGLLPGRLIPGDTPFNQTKGWADASLAIRAEQIRTNAVWIAAPDYGLTALLAHYLPDVPVFDLTDPFRYGFRPASPCSLAQRPGLRITRDDAGRGDVADTIVRTSGGATLARYRAVPFDRLSAAEIRALGCLPPNGTG